MTDIIKEMLVDVSNETGEWLGDMLLDTLDSMLRIETLMAEKGGILTASVVEGMYQYIYSLVVSLLVLKFLFKGFSIYILWRDGDADSSPQSMLIGALQAVITVIAFPYLYDIMADVTAEFCQRLMSFLGFSEESDMTRAVIMNVLRIPELILYVVYLILFFVLYIKLIQRGFELLILRLGVPFACMGLIDSDSGIFKSYMQVFVKTMFTSVIQLVLLKLSVPMMELAHYIIGVAIISTAFAAPLIMQQFMIPTGRGGGLTQKIYTGSMAIRAVSLLRGG